MNILIVKARDVYRKDMPWLRQQLQKLSVECEKLSKESPIVKECTLEALNYNLLGGADYVIIVGVAFSEAQEIIKSLAIIAKLNFTSQSPYSLTEDDLRKIKSKTMVLHHSSPDRAIPSHEKDRFYEGTLWLFSFHESESDYLIKLLLNFQYVNGKIIGDFLS